MEETKRIEALIRELDAQKDAYLEAFQKIHDSLTHNLAASSPRATSVRTGQRPASSAQASERETDSRLSTTRAATSVHASTLSKSTGEDSDHEDEALYVQDPLPPETFDEEGLRAHLQTHRFSGFCKTILSDVVDNPTRLTHGPLLPNRPGPYEDRSHYTHSQVFDIALDGAPLWVDQSAMEVTSGRGMALWHAISSLNPPSKERRAVGRIIVVREPSPILFAAVHYAMHQSFDMEELFRHLVEADLSSARMFRAFEDSEVRRRSFVFNFEYFTLIGKDCQPMDWQMCAGQEDRKPGYIQISRCSSVIALSLGGAPVKHIKNPSRQRRSPKDKGEIYDPFAPWKVLNIQCYPDWKASLNVHDSTRHYVNGPDAFLHTLLGEFRDAGRRFDDITKRISRRVKPTYEFIFDSGNREQLLFEDDEYNIVKRYFWAHQTLGIMNESMEALIDAFEDTFTADVWEGKHHTLWPLLDENSARNKHFKKKLIDLKKSFEAEMTNFRKLIEENHDRQKEIIGLRDSLFSGTSIKESRTTIQQGHNIKLLTLVSIFFLPLTFVTSVFGMTNMPTVRHYWMFGLVTATVCIPFFVLIGSLNTNRGLRFWRTRTKDAFNSLANFFFWATRQRRRRKSELTPVKSFESDGMSLRRYSSNPRRGRGVYAEEPSTREDAQIRLDGARPRSRSRNFSAGNAWERVSIDGSSTIASMWNEERKRRLKYSEDV